PCYGRRARLQRENDRKLFRSGLHRFGIRRPRSQIMLGVLIVVLRGNNIAVQDFGLGHGHIALVASLRILKAPWPIARAVRIPPFGTRVERARRSGLARVHVCVRAIWDGSLLGKAVNILIGGGPSVWRQRRVGTCRLSAISMYEL